MRKSKLAPRRSETFRYLQDDPIKPAAIDHVCEEVWFAETLGQRYNFLDYIFEDARARIRARAYLSDINVVTIHPAYLKNSDGGPHGEIKAPELRASVIAYLRRRYLHIEPDDPPPKTRKPR